MQILTFSDRLFIEQSLAYRRGVCEIARRLGKDHSVISRELQRNQTTHTPYRAATAQAYADRRARKTNVRKLEKDAALKEHVVARLRDDWSPEQIAGTLKTQPPPVLRGARVSHETIYHYIYDGEGRYEHLWSHLARTHQKRYRKHGRKHQKAHILERISIHERPAVIDERGRFGDWESDTMQFQKQKTGLSVQYERKGMLTRIHKVPDKSAEATDAALRDTLDPLPADLRQSLTFDNGGEGACHARIRDDFGVATYFCDPYASWQKGGVENTNGLIRRYLPRSTDLATITDAEIETIQERLNNRPRKKLNFLTPNQVLHSYLEGGGALNS